jgi:hypothetical protein
MVGLIRGSKWGGNCCVRLLRWKSDRTVRILMVGRGVWNLGLARKNSIENVGEQAVLRSVCKIFKGLR